MQTFVSSQIHVQNSVHIVLPGFAPANYVCYNDGTDKPVIPLENCNLILRVKKFIWVAWYEKGSQLRPVCLKIIMYRPVSILRSEKQYTFHERYQVLSPTLPPSHLSTCRTRNYAGKYLWESFSISYCFAIPIFLCLF